MSAPVHYCPTSCKWTPEPTLNKKSQDCSVIMYPVKKQATRHIWKSRFSCKSIYVHSGPILHKYFLYAILAQIDPDKIVDYFPVQSCLWAVGQHCKVIFLYNVGSGRSRQHCIYSLFSCENILCTLGQHCASMFLCNVVLDVIKQNWLDNIPMGWLAHLVSRFACNTRVIRWCEFKSISFPCQIAVTKTYNQFMK